MSLKDLTMPEKLFGASKKHHTSYHPHDLVAIASPIPSTILIDNDPMFAYTFERVARHNYIPLRLFESFVSMRSNLCWEYDLVLLDQATIGDEHLLETANEIRETNEKATIVVIGNQDSYPREQHLWADIIDGYANKKWGVESVIHNALRVFMQSVNQPRETRKSYGKRNVIKDQDPWF